MTARSDSPWADPDTVTQPGAPYAGPPATVPYPPPSGYPVGPYGYPGQPPYGYPAPYGYPTAYGYPAPYPYGYPGYWGPPPAARGPRRPGQVTTSAVLAFVQAALVVLTSVYVYFLASLFEILARQLPFGGDGSGLATEGTVVASLQLASAVFLVVAGIRALGRRTAWAWRLLVGALAVQVALAVYWLFRLIEFDNDLPGPDDATPFVAMTLFYAAMPVVALGLVLLDPGKRWFDGTAEE